ncbi:hypothetical protein, conserved [Babesia ovata]|uniref:Uncharacterized protein n=1 Tax=Babesia ovata TaxID=189622 RepID=A0A2H6KA41_9APIC|nr:uncharacterized protein BOVATA_013460 [Babesia ovata]GBE59853.1 hypothetical protein, conserved [Babesia ovata]
MGENSSEVKEYDTEQPLDADMASPTNGSSGAVNSDEDVGESEPGEAATQDENGLSEVQEEEMQVGQYSKNRTDKDVLVAKLLCRWWYVLPDWPPKDYNYHEQLQKNMLKCYPVKEFEDRENVDSNGYRKCYQLSAFPGVFRDFKGVAYDLRPLEGKPCYNNMIQKSEAELRSLIKKAIKNQIAKLSSSPRDEAALIKSLKEV